LVAFDNAYADPRRAAAYAGLEFPGTYYLAFRDLPILIARHVTGSNALDFGCGTGRSSRFLTGLGFVTIGVDISQEMVQQARSIDPEGSYLVIGDGEIEPLGGNRFDLVLAAFTFDNVPDADHKARLFGRLAATLGPDGRIIAVVSSPEIYVHEWASFSTRDFPENKTAANGDPVRIVITDIPDSRPVEDILCDDAAYRSVFDRSGLRVVAEHHPIGTREEPYNWVSETRLSPWSIYVLAPLAGGRRGDGRLDE
jgi:SAM-dependent methyltransferase